MSGNATEKWWSKETTKNLSVAGPRSRKRNSKYDGDTESDHEKQPKTSDPKQKKKPQKKANLTKSTKRKRSNSKVQNDGEDSSPVSAMDSGVPPLPTINRTVDVTSPPMKDSSLGETNIEAPQCSDELRIAEGAISHVTPSSHSTIQPDSAAVVATVSKPSRSPPKTEWSSDMTNDPDVLKGWVYLHPDGTAIDCLICGGRPLQMRRPFNDYNWRCHTIVNAHLSKKAAKENTERRRKAGIDKYVFECLELYNLAGCYYLSRSELI
jgi:hypothetical protein